MNRPASTRRDFLTTSFAATAAAATFVPSHVLGRDGATAASEKISFGIIGIGPRCTYDVKSMLPFGDVRSVAIADVQASRRTAGKKLIDEHYGNADCVLYRDFRELLDRKDIDAVLIATGDRWHGAASMLAAEAGKDVYSEKPCGITIATCQELADTMHREKRVFQAGTQRRSVPNFQKAVEWVHSGKLGKLHTMHASVIFRRSTTPGCPLNRCRHARSWTGTCGLARPHGDRSIRPTVTVAGEGNGTLIQEPACSTGELTRSISVSGPIRPTTQCQSNMNRPRRTSSADTPMA